jgi:protein-S-isoprenylcysteine O-methyltransferase Ste14
MPPVVPHLGGSYSIMAEALQAGDRARNEERVLARAFPDYVSYMRRTPMLLPRLFIRAEEDPSHHTS